MGSNVAVNALPAVLPAVLPAGAAEIGDPDATRTVYSIIALLVVLGLALLMLAIWTWRVTRPDPELLAPLELMGERRWRRSDPVWQRRQLDFVRPVNSDPLSRPSAPPDLDEAFDRGPRAFGFSDLRDVAVPGEPALLRGDDRSRTEPVGDEVPGGTPIALKRPLLDELGDSEIDSRTMAEAEAQLDAELRRNRLGP